MCQFDPRADGHPLAIIMDTKPYNSYYFTRAVEEITITRNLMDLEDMRRRTITAIRLLIMGVLESEE